MGHKCLTDEALASKKVHKTSLMQQGEKEEKEEQGNLAFMRMTL
jgi:hypothetical protein